jgi:hypothetical protein
MPEPFTVLALTAVTINVGKIIYGLGSEVKYQKKIRKKQINLKKLCMVNIKNINHENCTICLEEPEDCSQLKCGHIYHKECINEWFKKKKTCPNCRKIMF